MPQWFHKNYPKLHKSQMGWLSDWVSQPIQQLHSLTIEFPHGNDPTSVDLALLVWEWREKTKTGQVYSLLLKKMMNTGL